MTGNDRDDGTFEERCGGTKKTLVYQLTSADRSAIAAATACACCGRTYNQTASCYVRVLCARHKFVVDDGSGRIVGLLVTDIVDGTDAMSGSAPEGWSGLLVYSARSAGA